ncbi:MAG: HAD-IIIA family hydrolase [Bacteroidetes bacterium]|nr:HAD-IIIA family hydrolase [Bacteroidota bacterium]
MSNYKELLKNINTFIFDYDGVLTDGSVITMNRGEGFRVSNVKDGYALQLAKKKGYNVAIISGAKADCMINRMKSLNITDVYLGVENKMEVYREYLKENGIEDSHVLFMGDDIPDYEIMLKAGLSTCPSDAAEEIKTIAKYISHFNGGKGCVRDVIEQVLKIQGKWMNDDAYHW